MSDFQASNARREWIANMRDVIFDAAAAGAREWLERFLPPLRGNHAELLVERADGDRAEFARALDSVVLDYECALRDMFAATLDPRAVLAEEACRYCGEQCCPDRDEHDRWYRASETTIREQVSGYERNPFTGKLAPVYKSSAAGAVGVGPLSALGTGQSAAAERAADAGTSAAHQTPAGGSHPPSTTAGRGVAGKSEGDVPATPAGACPSGCYDGAVYVGGCNCIGGVDWPHEALCGYEPCPDHEYTGGAA